jgi:hypothetical protein
VSRKASDGDQDQESLGVGGYSTFRIPERLDQHATSMTIDERARDDLLDGIDVEANVQKEPPRTRKVRIEISTARSVEETVGC